MGLLIRGRDWAATPLGPAEAWPQPLKTLTGVMLAANQPMFIAWGSERTLLYNNAYAEILAGKHPAALGRDFLQVWAEITSDLLPIVEEAYAGRPVHRDEIELVLLRKGYPEETHFAFSYTPVRNEAGDVEGFLCACREVTDQVLAERRKGFQLALEERLRDMSDPDEVVAASVGMLGQHLAADRVGYGHVQPDAATVRLSQCYAVGVEPLYGEFPLRDFGPASLVTQRRGETAICADVLEEPGQPAAVWTTIDTRACVSAPLVREARFSALLYVNAREPRHWSANEVALIEEVAARTWDAVERARAATALRGSLALAQRTAAELRAVLESMPDAVYIGGAEGITLANQPALDQLGFSTRDELNRHVGTLAEEIQTRDAATGELIPAEGQAFMRAFGGERVVQDVRVRHRLTGEERIVRCAAAPVVIDGQVIAAVAVNTDVTEARAAEAELRASEARLAFLDRLGAETASLAGADAVLATTTRLLGEHLNLSVCAYADMDEDEDGFTIRGDWAAPGSSSIRGRYRLADFGKLAVKNLSAGLPLVVNDNLRELDPDEAATFQAIGIAATICMPLVKEGRLTALMAIHDRVPRAWTDGELSLLREVTARSWAHVERVAAAEELRESEARFRLMADAVPQIVWITDAEGRVEFFNKQWVAYVGAPDVPSTADDVAASYVHPDDQAATMAAFEEARRTGRPYKIEHRIRSAAGDYRSFLVRGEPYRDPSTGEVTRWFGASVDISDRRQAELALEELNETLESRVAELAAERDQLWRRSRDPFVVCHLDGRWLSASPAWTDILGWTEAELVGRTSEWMVHPDDRIETRDKLAGLADGEAMREFTNRFRDRDGRYHAFSWTAVAEGDRLFCVARDVTVERERAAKLAAAEAARREADALYRAYFENTAEALFVVGVLPDGGFTIEDLNPAHEASVGLRLADVVGKRLDEVLPAATAELAMSHYRPVLESGEVGQYREAFELQGRMTYWDTVLVPVRDSDGRVVRLIGSSRDLTREIAAEEALRQSQKLESMGQLTGGVAHDFNNLLTPIVGSLDMLVRRGVGDERERRLIDGALQSAERAKVLVQRLLAFARRQPLQPTAVDIGKLVENMADLIASTTGPQIRVAVEVSPDLPRASADPNQVEMALLNLAVNARDAMPDGGTLRITAAGEGVRAGNPANLKPGKYVRLSVADTGVGMDQATLARAVEPFFSTKGVGKGTGLGLSMAHGLASQLGGALMIRSRRRVGTNVELWLPVSKAPAEALDAISGPAAQLAGQGTALLVDDEELVRMSTADMLTELGYAVVEADSAERALELVRGGLEPTVLVTDHLMPGMNGTDLARVLQGVRPELQVLVVSGYAESEGIAPDLPRLTKPFRNDELASSLAALKA